MPRVPAKAAPEEPDPLAQSGEEQAGAPPDSEASSEASSASDLLEDPGPEFDAGQAGQDAAARDEDRRLSIAPGGSTGVELEWAPDAVRSLLETAGAAGHAIAGKAEEDWVFTKVELDAISKPLTRILNRYDATRVAAGTGDELALILGFVGYTLRSVQERKKAIQAQQEQEEQEQQTPLFGVPQPPIQEPPIQ